MANIQLLAPLILKWEGGYVNDSADRGGATNKGVTLAAWQRWGYDKNGDGVIDVEDLKLITEEDVVERILRPHYWNRWQADRIASQALANILVDWVWGSGRYGITIPQRILGVRADGIAGKKTLRALNASPDPEGLFEKIKQAREAYFNRICKNRPANRRFLQGWLNRLNDFKWIPMSLLFCVLLSCRSVQKTETLNEEQRMKGERQTAIAERKEYNEDRDGHLSENQNEVRTTETLTAVFDTLDSKPALKALRISRTVYGRTVRTEQQIERRTEGMETTEARQMMKGESQTAIRTELKEKPARRSLVWWIAGGATIVLALILLKKRKAMGFS